MTLEEIFASAHRQLRPRTPLPEISIEFFPFAGLNHTARLRENRLRIRVSDIFTDAPAAIYHSLALILLSKLYRKKIDNEHHRVYRSFILEDNIQARARAARNGRSRQTRVCGSRGRFVDLEPMFDRLNIEYFAGNIPKPLVSWSTKKSRYVLGRFDAVHNVIFISRVFDSRDIPSYVCEYVMYHEMLHIKHHSQTHNSRLLVHTPEFRAAEKHFRQYREAKLWLREF